MKNIFRKLLDRGPVSITLAVVLSVLFVTGLVNAATTISTNISTAGTLTVDTTSTLTGAVTMGSTLAVSGAVNASSTLATSGKITVPNGYGLDTAGAGTLNLGTSTATSVIIGSATAKVGIASTSPYVALGVTGTTTASAGMVIGALGSPVTQLLFGTCSVDPADSLAATTTQSATCTATGVVAGDKIFVTSPSNLEFNLLFTGATAAAGSITITVFNNSTTTISATAKTWSWMAIR